MNGKHNCFGWDVAMCKCMILSETICKKREDCPFFKTPHQAKEEAQNTEKRLEAIRRGDITPAFVFPPTEVPKRVRDQSEYRENRKERLRAEGRCMACGKINDHPGKYYCSACYARKKALEKAKEALLYEE